MTKPSILVVGSSNTDMIIKVQRIPQPGETILGGEFALAAGGKGANQAVGAARAGGAVTFLARLGRDMFGDQALAGFVADGINVKHVVRDPAAPSGVALIFVARNGENSIAVASGANARLAPADLQRAQAAFRRAAVVVLQLETPLPTVTAAVKLAARAGARVILNPAPARPLPASLLRHVYLLTPNESEAQLLTGMAVHSEAAAARAADALLARGVQNVILTLGARGAFVAGPQARGRVPGFKVRPVDTTGAGDVFNGALAVALAEGKPLLEAARFANAAAALSVTRLGAQTSAPTRGEIDRRLAAARSN
ncbi:MAG TPA: ribokinase [Verrucomicrobiota bacterium]|nr:ribokinase [Verrucomicrobiota bacterium]HRR65756.1 ribokinase [Candidatus Paceibacterota bacterium]HOF72321.1 ribokinase [Verrucomicrobiota bacterium]HOM46831.1 ribokinase [Verrucomicrobiota bacterium]HOQ57351.1 ribokinase [Verrucomicrobiota bacterium]